MQYESNPIIEIESMTTHESLTKQTQPSPKMNGLKLSQLTTN